MTVKKLTTKQKEAVVVVYDSKTRTLKQIAGFLGVSTRTIGRVLEEAGLMKPVARLQADAKTVMALLYKHKITIEQLQHLLEEFPHTIAVAKQAMQTRHSRKSPKAHNGKQSLLGFDDHPFNTGVFQ